MGKILEYQMRETGPELLLIRDYEQHNAQYTRQESTVRANNERMTRGFKSIVTRRETERANALKKKEYLYTLHTCKQLHSSTRCVDDQPRP